MDTMGLLAVYRKYRCHLYGRPSMDLKIKVPMLKYEVVETLLYGCTSWDSLKDHYK